jgi:hypothetical protein
MAAEPVSSPGLPDEVVHARSVATTASLVADAAIVALSLGLFFAFGWVFFMKQLFRDYEVKKRSVQLLFSVTFALSCGLFELLLFEILGILGAR